MKAKEEYDFSNARQGAVVETSANKTRTTIRLDNDLTVGFATKCMKRVVAITRR